MEPIEKALPLDELPVGQRGRVITLDLEGALRRRIQDLGLIDRTVIEPVHRGSAGDPTAYLIRGAVVALRRQDAHRIRIQPLPEGGAEARWD